MVYLPWINPLPNETLPAYALRMAEPIDSSQPFALVGLSLGGMIAIEIAKQYRPEKIILISSIPVARSMPVSYKLAGWLGLHRFVPISIIKHASRIKRLFTTETTEDKNMLRSMIRDCDPAFIRWAFGAALGWKNKWIPENLFHIHGSADAILPVRYTKPGHIIPRAGHLMILNRAGQINQILEKLEQEN